MDVEKIYHVNTSQKKVEAATLLSDGADKTTANVKTSVVVRDGGEINMQNPEDFLGPWNYSI